MRVKEWKGTVVFLHEVAAGAAGRSWGVHVAELARRVPPQVVRRAAPTCSRRWKNSAVRQGHRSRLCRSLRPASAPDPPEPDPLAAAVAGLEPDQMTPRQALEALYRLKSLLPVSDTAASWSNTTDVDTRSPATARCLGRLVDRRPRGLG